MRWPGLVIYEFEYVVPAGEAGQQFQTMLVDPSFEIAGHPGVQHRIALICQNVNAIRFIHSYPVIARSAATKQSRSDGIQPRRDCFAALAMTTITAATRSPCAGIPPSTGGSRVWSLPGAGGRAAARHRCRCRARARWEDRSTPR